MTDLGLLHLFVKVVAHGSLSGAARELNISLPLAIRRLRQLETLLGVRLLQRTTRRQSLTEEGQLLYQHALQILDELASVEQRLSQSREAIVGPLRITAPVELGRRYIAPLLADFCTAHPGLNIQLQLTDTVLDLIESGMDVAIRYGALQDSSFISRPLAPNHRILCAAPDYLRRRGTPTHPGELSRHDCLLIGQQFQADWRFEGDAPVTVRITATLAANDGEVVHGWALAGYGIARKSIWDVFEDLASGRLVQILPRYPIPATPLHAVYPHSRHLAPRIRALLDYLGPHLSNLYKARRDSARTPRP
ncbi:MAG: LysR family transcriptional regulator [Candidatus Dactylopiibacterium carminicum]|nr:MAG: LysR family transcriptional regulator [Candidatus Dactylopiibacterium carminicum]